MTTITWAENANKHTTTITIKGHSEDKSVCNAVTTLAYALATYSIRLTAAGIKCDVNLDDPGYGRLAFKTPDEQLYANLCVGLQAIFCGFEMLSQTHSDHVKLVIRRAKIAA